MTSRTRILLRGTYSYTAVGEEGDPLPHSHILSVGAPAAFSHHNYFQRRLWGKLLGGELSKAPVA